MTLALLKKKLMTPKPASIELTASVLKVQVNKVTATPLLRAWRQHSKDKTVHVFVGRHRVLKMRHWLVQVSLLV